jgi:hypothetical protein
MPNRTIPLISMSELYDLVAGTSTGSLLATSLVFPNPDPNNVTRNKYFANDAITIYTTDAPIVFTKYAIGAWGRFWGTVIFTLIGALIGLLIGHKIYFNKQHEETMIAFKEYMKARKVNTKGHAHNTQVESTLSQNVSEHLKDVFHGEEIKAKMDSEDL